MGIENSNSGEQERNPELPCIAMVVSHGDSTYMGRLKVELLRNAGNDNDKSPGQIIEVDYMTPFYGTMTMLIQIPMIITIHKKVLVCG